VLKQRAENVTKICYAQCSGKENFFQRRDFAVLLDNHFVFAHKFNKFSGKRNAKKKEKIVQVIRKLGLNLSEGSAPFLLEMK
jgi:hypothetical protein